MPPFDHDSVLPNLLGGGALEFPAEAEALGPLRTVSRFFVSGARGSVHNALPSWSGNYLAHPINCLELSALTHWRDERTFVLCKVTYTAKQCGGMFVLSQ